MRDGTEAGGLGRWRGGVRAGENEALLCVWNSLSLPSM